jgi:hypothetical protein
MSGGNPFVEIENQNPRTTHHGDRFGNWRFDARYNQPSLDYIGPVGLYHGFTQANPYWVPLARLNTEAQLSGWIEHLETTGWWYEGTNRADFIGAVRRLWATGYIHRGKQHDVR